MSSPLTRMVPAGGSRASSAIRTSTRSSWPGGQPATSANWPMSVRCRADAGWLRQHEKEKGRGTVRLLVTGGTGVLGRAFLPLAEAEGHQVSAPGRAELDLFDPAAVAGQLRGVDAVLHLATRIQPLEKMGQPRGMAPERPAARRGLGHPGRRGAGRRRQGVHPADRHVRLPGRPARHGGDEHTGRRPGHPALRAGRRGAGRQVRRGRAARRGAAPRACSTARAPATTSRTRPWAPRCTPRTPGARCSPRSPSRAASTTSAATGSGSATAGSPRPPAGDRGTRQRDAGARTAYHRGGTGFHPVCLLSGDARRLTASYLPQ